MKLIGLAAGFLLLWAVPSITGQETLQQQLNQFLMQHKDEKSETLTLSQCSARLREWEMWADENVPKHERLLADYDTLTAENAHLNVRLERQSWVVMQWIFFCAAGLGAGVIAAFMIPKVVRRVWPLSPAHKQLVILILGAVWITAAGLLCLFDSRLSDHPVNLLAAVGVYSLPAILFGGIIFWWIGKNQARSLA